MVQEENEIDEVDCGGVCAFIIVSVIMIIPVIFLILHYTKVIDIGWDGIFGCSITLGIFGFILLLGALSALH